MKLMIEVQVQSPVTLFLKLLNLGVGELFGKKYKN